MTDTATEIGYHAAYQGAPGAYSELAAQQLLEGEVRLLPARALEDVFAAVAAGRARFGVVPLENTIAGTVPGIYELLLSHELRIVAETTVAIDHALIGPPALDFAGVRRVLSHPVALGQCHDFLRRHPWIEPVAAFDTAGAVKLVIDENDGKSAAIAGRHAAAVYGGRVLAEHLQDHAENWTRFVLLDRRGDASRHPRARKVLLVFDLLHEPGSLARALQPAADGGVNLTKIESRPIATRPFEYRFIVELSGGSAQAIADVVAAMAVRTASLRVLGEYEPGTAGADHG